MFVAACMATNSSGVAQEPFILVPANPKDGSGTNQPDTKSDARLNTDRPKQRIPNIPMEAVRLEAGDGSLTSTESIGLEEPPLLKSFPTGKSVPDRNTVAPDNGVLMLGQVPGSAGSSSRNAPQTIAPINDQLPVIKQNTLIRETSNANLPAPTGSTADAENVVPTLSLAWQLANASNLPFSPVLLWQGIRREPESMTSLVPTEIGSGVGMPLLEVVENSEPPAFQGLTLEKSPSEKTSAMPIASATKTPDQSSSESKRVRSVRIPFGDEEPIDAEEPAIRPNPSRPPLASLAELDEQKGQESPVIDTRSLDRAKDEQGADALQAAKPATPPKRKIKIEDPQVDGQIVPAKPTDAPIVVNAAEALRLRRAQACLDHYMNFPESTSVRSPWAVMHALLPFGGDYEMIHGNQRVNAIGWMCHNGTCRTQRIFTPSRNGFIPNVGGGVQGHAGQFMAILAQCGVPLDYPIQVGNQKYKVEDLVRYEMATCREKSELTFKLIGLSYYLDSNKQWRSNDGKVWSIPKLISEELAQPIKGAACGGTHRLMGYSFAVKQRAIQGLPIDGQYARADKFVKDYVEYAWKLQNSDGSFSTSWLEGRADEPNEERKVQTTGHILEWLLFTIPDSELNTPKVQKSVDFLLTKIYDKKDYKWPIGPRGHATRAVSLYLNRYDEIKMSKPELLRADVKTASPRSSEPFSRR